MFPSKITACGSDLVPSFLPKSYEVTGFLSAFKLILISPFDSIKANSTSAKLKAFFERICCKNSCPVILSLDKLSSMILPFLIKTLSLPCKML